MRISSSFDTTTFLAFLFSSSYYEQSSTTFVIPLRLSESLIFFLPHNFCFQFYFISFYILLFYFVSFCRFDILFCWFFSSPFLFWHDKLNLKWRDSTDQMLKFGAENERNKKIIIKSIYFFYSSTFAWL